MNRTSGTSSMIQTRFNPKFDPGCKVIDVPIPVKKLLWILARRIGTEGEPKGTPGYPFPFDSENPELWFLYQLYRTVTSHSLMCGPSNPCWFAENPAGIA